MAIKHHSPDSYRLKFASFCLIEGCPYLTSRPLCEGVKEYVTKVRLLKREIMERGRVYKLA